MRRERSICGRIYTFALEPLTNQTEKHFPAKIAKSGSFKGMDDEGVGSHGIFLRYDLPRDDDFDQGFVHDVRYGINMLKDVGRGVIVSEKKQSIVYP